MRGQPSAWRRTQRLAVMRQRTEVFALAQRLAPELGMSAEDLLAEARALQRRLQVAGVVTRDQELAFVAAEGGITEDELRAELARVRADA